MFNLLPKQEGEEVKREYRYRLVIISVIFLTASFFLGIILLIPSYIISSKREKRVSLEYEEAKKVSEASEYKDLNDVIGKTNEKLGILTPKEGALYLHDVISNIVRLKNSGIKIDRFSFKAGREIQVSGTALNRESLLSFTRSLERDKTFSGVETPISNFARNTDIDFSIKVTGNF